jgi:predicted amidohydrolase YtcJ
MASRLATILVIVIVGATLIAGLMVGAQRDDANGPVDLIIVNGKVYPGGGANMQEAVAVRGNQILRVGSNRDVKRLRRAQTLVLDAHGATVLPGLNDSHVQLTAGAESLDQLDLSSAATLSDLETLISDYAAGMTSREWVIGRNGNRALFATPNVAARKILDGDIPDRPVLLTSDDGTVAWANSEALKRAGIGAGTRVASGGTLVKDRKTAEPSGVLRGKAIDLMTHVLPEASHAQKLVALSAAIDEAHKLGVTSVQTANGTDEEMGLLKELREQGDLSVRVYGSLTVSEDVDAAAVAELDTLRAMYPDDPTLKLGGAEVICSCDAEKLQRTVTLLDKHDWQVMVRAPGEEDVHAALDAFEYAISVNPAPPNGRRFRLQDVKEITAEDLARLPRLNVLTEPFGADESPDPTPLWSALTDAGARLLFASDWPERPFDPRDTMHAALNAPAEAPAAEPITPTARSLRSIVDAYTSQAAFASYDEHRKGKLAPGMLADIVIFSNDIFQDPPQSLKEATVTVTIFDGKVVYQRPPHATSN